MNAKKKEHNQAMNNLLNGFNWCFEEYAPTAFHGKLIRDPEILKARLESPDYLGFAILEKCRPFLMSELQTIDALTVGVGIIDRDFFSFMHTKTATKGYAIFNGTMFKHLEGMKKEKLFGTYQIRENLPPALVKYIGKIMSHKHFDLQLDKPPSLYQNESLLPETLFQNAFKYNCKKLSHRYARISLGENED